MNFSHLSVCAHHPRRCEKAWCCCCPRWVNRAGLSLPPNPITAAAPPRTASPPSTRTLGSLGARISSLCSTPPRACSCSHTVNLQWQDGSTLECSPARARTTATLSAFELRFGNEMMRCQDNSSATHATHTHLAASACLRLLQNVAILDAAEAPLIPSFCG